MGEHRLECREWTKSQVNVYCLTRAWSYLGPECLTPIRGANPSHVRLKGMSQPASSQAVSVEGIGTNYITHSFLLQDDGYNLRG